MICVVCIYFLPESPKYLISKKKYDEAREALTIIAKMNNYKDKIDFKFDREVAEANGKEITLNATESSIDKNQSDKELLKTPI